MAGEAVKASCQRCTSASQVGPASEHVTSTYDCAILMWTFCHIAHLHLRVCNYLILLTGISGYKHCHFA